MSQAVSSGLSAHSHNLNVKTILTTLGVGFVLYKAFSFAKTSLSHHSTPSSNAMANRYGKSTWALITTSSDNPGKVFAIELAKQGFNIVLIGNDARKLREVEHELEEAFPTIQIRTVAVDYMNSYTKGFAKQIFKQCQDLDISIIVNNVGVGELTPNSNLTATGLTDKVISNCLSHVLITRAFLPKLATRPHRSCIANVATFMSTCPKAALKPSASKMFYENLSRRLVDEYTNIDMLSLLPARASTHTRDCKKRNSACCLNSKQQGRSSVGGGRQSTETFDHDEAQQALLSSIPELLNIYSIVEI